MMPLFFDEDTAGWVRWTVAGFVALVVMVIATMVVLVTTGGDESAGGPGTDGPTPTAGSSSSAAAASSSRCGLPDGDQAVPTSAPDATWSGEPVAVPSSPAYGPGLEDRTCYARSPLGAVFFAMNAGSGADDEASGQAARWLGFRVVDYAPDRTHLLLVAIATEGAHAGTTIGMETEVEWVAGDWTFADPDEPFQADVLDSLSGVVPFGPTAA